MTALPIVMAAVDYDRFRALVDGRVIPDGIDLEFVSLQVEEIFYRQIKYAEFDVSEMSLSSYVVRMSDPEFPFIAIPAFPSRYFRHQSIFVRADSGVQEPSDLRGKRVGVPEFQITAGVWQRGILADEYGVDIRDLRWFSGGVDRVGRVEKQRITPPDGVSLEQIRANQTLSGMILDGELDAIMSAHEPSAFRTSDQVVRLFPNYREVEQDYFRRTSIFPIMHVVVVKKHLLNEHPWVARSLLTAFERALAIAREDLRYRSSLKLMLPWLSDHLDETVAVMGEDFWTYGLEANHHVLSTFLRYSFDQGLAARPYEPEELFAPSTLTSFVI